MLIPNSLKSPKRCVHCKDHKIKLSKRKYCTVVHWNNGYFKQRFSYELLWPESNNCGINARNSVGSHTSKGTQQERKFRWILECSVCSVCTLLCKIWKFCCHDESRDTPCFHSDNFANTSLKWMTSSSSASGGMTSRPTWSPASSISGNSHVSWSIPVPIYCYINAGVFDAVGRVALLLLVWFLQREGKTLQIILNRCSGTVVRGRTVVVWLTKKSFVEISLILHQIEFPKTRSGQGSSSMIFGFGSHAKFFGGDRIRYTGWRSTYALYRKTSYLPPSFGIPDWLSYFSFCVTGIISFSNFLLFTSLISLINEWYVTVTGYHINFWISLVFSSDLTGWITHYGTT